MLLAPQLAAKAELEGRLIDIAAETSPAADDNLADLGELPVRPKRGRVTGGKPDRQAIDNPCPLDHLNAACEAKHALQDLVRRCGQNLACWERELTRPKA